MQFMTPDAYIKLWDMWYLDKMITAAGQFYDTNHLFYADGLDLTYHTFHVPHIALAALLKPFTELIGAFNVIGILFMWITAYGGYQLIRAVLYLHPRPPLHYVEMGCKKQGAREVRLVWEANLTTTLWDLG